MTAPSPAKVRFRGGGGGGYEYVPVDGAMAADAAAAPPTLSSRALALVAADGGADGALRTLIEAPFERQTANAQMAAVAPELAAKMDLSLKGVALALVENHVLGVFGRIAGGLARATRTRARDAIGEAAAPLRRFVIAQAAAVAAGLITYLSCFGVARRGDAAERAAGGGGYVCRAALFGWCSHPTATMRWCVLWWCVYELQRRGTRSRRSAAGACCGPRSRRRGSSLRSTAAAARSGPARASTRCAPSRSRARSACSARSRRASRRAGGRRRRRGEQRARRGPTRHALATRTALQARTA